MQKIYLLIGCPGVGKSWVSFQLRDKYTPIEHDDFRGRENQYVPTLIKEARLGAKPIIANTPFGVTEMMAEIARYGADCIPVFIIDNEETIKRRYLLRDGHEIPPGHLTRQKTYLKRAHNMRAFTGNSDRVLAHLKSLHP